MSEWVQVWSRMLGYWLGCSCGHFHGGKGRVRCTWVLRAVHVSVLVSTDVRSYGSEKQGLGKVGLQGTLGGGAAQIYVWALKNDLCGVLLLSSSLARLLLLWPCCSPFYEMLSTSWVVWVESSSSPDPHSQVGLEGGGKKQQRGKSRNGRLEELDHCQVGGGWALPPPPTFSSISAVGAKA